MSKMTLGVALSPGCLSLTPYKAWKQAEQSVSSQVIANIEKAPSKNPAIKPNLQPQYYQCSNCDSPQPIQMECVRCGCKRTFRCFENCCVKPDQWEGFRCRYCHPIERINKTPAPSFESIDLSMDWLQQEKVQLYLAKTRMFSDNRFLISGVIPSRTQFICFHCHKPERLNAEVKYYEWESDAIKWKNNRMDDEWFCNKCKEKHSIADEYIENYCYLCTSPMPIARDCKKCKKFYTFRCIYPPKCITTAFQDHLGTDRWDHCPDCLSKQEFEMVDAKMCSEAEKQYMHEKLKGTLDTLSSRIRCRPGIIRKSCSFMVPVCDPINVLRCVALLIAVLVFCLYFIT